VEEGMECGPCAMEDAEDVFLAIGNEGGLREGS